MKLSILIPTVPTRNSLLSRLLYRIERQLTSGVEVIVHTGLLPMGDKYTKMVSMSKGEFVLMVDDDDLLMDDYISTVLPKLNDIDFLGYDILTLKDNKYWLTITHSYEYRNLAWIIDGDRSARGVSNKCPIRRSIASKFAFGNAYSADVQYIKEIEKSDLIKKWDYINKTMYLYDFRSHGTIGTSSNDQSYQQNYNTQLDVGMYPYTKEKFIWI